MRSGHTNFQGPILRNGSVMAVGTKEFTDQVGDEAEQIQANSVWLGWIWVTIKL